MDIYSDLKVDMVEDEGTGTIMTMVSWERENRQMFYKCDVLWCTSVCVTVVIIGLLPQLQAQEVIMEEGRVTAEAEGATGAVVQDTAVREVVLVEAAGEVMVAMMAVRKKSLPWVLLFYSDLVLTTRPYKD